MSILCSHLYSFIYLFYSHTHTHTKHDDDSALRRLLSLFIHSFIQHTKKQRPKTCPIFIYSFYTQKNSALRRLPPLFIHSFIYSTHKKTQRLRVLSLRPALPRPRAGLRGAVGVAGVRDAESQGEMRRNEVRRIRLGVFSFLKKRVMR